MQAYRSGYLSLLTILAFASAIAPASPSDHPDNGGSLGIPAGFPSDIHLPLKYTYRKGDQKTSLSLWSDTPTDEFADEYNKAMQAKGWSGSINVRPAPDQTTGTFRKGVRTTQVTIDAEPTISPAYIEIKTFGPLVAGEAFAADGSLPPDGYLPASARIVPNHRAQSKTVGLNVDESSSALISEYHQAMRLAGFELQVEGASASSDFTMIYNKPNSQRNVTVAIFSGGGDKSSELILSDTNIGP